MKPISQAYLFVCQASFGQQLTIFNLIQMSKQLVGTSLYALDTHLNLKIPVAQSFLPVQTVMGAHQDLPKELIYNNDARNAHFQATITCSNGVDESTKLLQFSKEELTKFFEKIEKIQDELNTYM